ncbi:MAG TPA: HlyD family efflux transporter periplasmic adaptor subunit [Nevskiaceae bacterium]|nr:HlyD family efflux transporter periplasmic adaptor subunit [Nevskiaceae bacterium]
MTIEQARNIRQRGFTLLALAVAAGVAAYASWWALEGRHYQDTDDAYVSGDVVQVTSEVAGTVISLAADDTQGVQRGQNLLALDPADAQVAADRADADLARAVRNVRALQAQSQQLRAQVNERTTALSRAQADLQRRASLVDSGAVSHEELAHARETVRQAQADLAAAREQANVIDAQIENTTLQTHPQVQAAEAAVREAALALRRTHIAAPVDGVVARRAVQLGQRVAAGTPLLAVVPLDGVWVDANFKEVQLADLRIGQPVTLHADFYGDDVVYHGRVAGLAAGSGSAFALLPAQNASGNWIKIVQRVPVRIALDADELKAHPLRIGLSMNAKVDVRDTTGALIAASVRGTPLPQQASLAADPAVESRIARIVADNSSAATLAMAGAQP